MTPLDPPIDDQDRTLPPDSDRTIPSDPRTMPSREDSPEPSRTTSTTPAPIGNYTIVGKLGEGGMGVVYEAEQRNPQRKVALKVVRGGHFVDEVSIKMFQREAETLGRLKHPGIGAIYESGRTDEGQHFFAMELVRGTTLGAYIIENDPSEPNRLALFRKICDAVNYAHQRGVIHRDLKPSNILIDKDGAPKILDFGLARITDTDTNAASMVSEVGAIKGTLPYMSPEQARGNPDEIDLRTDVYSLGVILYELLTGARPYDTDKSSILKAIRVIAEESPASFASLGSTGRPAGGELETITRKALEKEPDHRYQSAAALSEDIERHLTNQPILARPPSTIYQLKKLVARNKLPFAFAATLVMLLIGFGVWMSVLFTRAEIARQESEAVTDFLSNMLAAVDPGEQGRDVTVREVLDEGAKTIDDEFGEQPLVRARLMSTMGSVYTNLGLYEPARALLEDALVIRERELPSDHEDVAESLNKHANVLSDLGDYEAARPLYERALAMREKSLGPDHPNVALTLNNLAILLRRTGEYGDARRLYERALAIHERERGPDHPDVAASLNNLANVLWDTGDLEGARARLERALAIREKALGPEHPDVGRSLTTLGALLHAIGDYSGARPLYERALAVEEKALGPEHPRLAICLNNLGLLSIDTRNFEEARPFLDRALAIQEKALGPEHPDLTRSLQNQALVLTESGDYSAALSVHERALAIREKHLRPNHPEVARSLNSIGLVYRKMEDNAKARPLYERSLEIFESEFGPDHVSVGAGMHNLACLYRDLGEYAIAREYFEKAQIVWENAFEPGHHVLAENLEQHAQLLRILGDDASAGEMEARASAIREALEAN